MTVSLILKQEGVDEEMQRVQCLDWNASGTTVAVGYGSAKHEDWCAHKGEFIDDFSLYFVVF